MLIDKILDFLFRTRAGNAVLLVGVLASSFLFGGCFVFDVSACACESMGCEGCADCWSSCDYNCNSCVMEGCSPACGGDGYRSSGCGPIDCLFGNGCENDCGDCGTCYYGGCNRTIFTECGSCDCSAGCGDCVIGCDNCTYSCDDRYDGGYTTTLSIEYYYEVFSEESYWGWVENSVGYMEGFTLDSAFSYDYRNPVTQVPVRDYDNRFIEFKGFFRDSAHTIPLTDANGLWTANVSIDSLDIIYGYFAEKYKGEPRTFVFDLPSFVETSIPNYSINVGNMVGGFPEGPAVPGYRFDGWMMNGSFVTIQNGYNFHLCQVQTTDAFITLTASYTPERYSVTFKSHERPWTLTGIDYGTTLGALKEELDESFLEDDYGVIIGWEDENGNPLPDSYVIDKDQTIYARYNRYLTVNFRTHETTVTLQKILSGTTLGDLREQLDEDSLFLNQDYGVFIGWGDEEGNPLPDSYLIEDDLIIVARYNKYLTLTLYNYYGPDSAQPYTERVLEGDTYDLPTPSGNGIVEYKFVGWYDNAECKGSSYNYVTVSEKHTEFYALWRGVNSFTVSLYRNAGDTMAFATVVYTIEDSDREGVDLSEYFLSDVEFGYEFVGWCRQRNLSDEPVMRLDKGIRGDISMYAKIVAKKYNVYLDAMDGNLNGASYKETTVEYGSQFTLPVPTKTNYVFDGWYLLNGTRVTDGEGKSLVPLTKDTLGTESFDQVTLIARYSTKKYVVTFYTYNESGAQTIYATVTYEHGAQLGSPADISVNPTRRGYTFKGWFTAATGGSQYNSTDTVTNDRVFYAQFDANHYTIYLDVNGGSISNSEVSVTFGQSDISLGRPTRDGYYFTGWYDQAGNQITNQNGTLQGPYNWDEDLHLHAEWVYMGTSSNVQDVNDLPVEQYVLDGERLRRREN